jgi:curli biogenesis system outer membrane secretion channel CsgG
MVGKCSDETGKYGDALSPYSRIVTQACGMVLSDVLAKAGFLVAERDPQNLGLIAQEYQMGHNFATPAKPGAAPQNVGLIQREGPNGGLTGARYMITGGILSYDTSVRNGGGGVDVDAIGFSVRNSQAKVAVSLRIVDVSTGLVVNSILLTTEVTGQTTDYHITRIIGDVTNAVATVVGGVGSTTVSRPDIDNHIVSAELGMAQSLPVNYAVVDALTVGTARLLEVDQNRFYYGEPVHFDYDRPKDESPTG